ncbi:MAG: hypothetical protein AAGH64_04560 [Planctomycetota bacterium]
MTAARHAVRPRWTPLMPVLGLAFAGVAMGAAAACTSSWGVFGHERTKTSRLDIGAQPTLRIVGEVGDLQIVGSPDADRIRALVRLVGRGDTADDAEARLNELTGTLQRKGGVVLASTEHPEFTGPYPYAAYWSITAPVGTRVEVRNDVGDVVIYNTRAAVDVRNDVGDVWIAGVTDATVRVDVGDATVSATGALDVAGDVGDVQAHTTAHATSHSVTNDVGDVLVVLPTEWAGGFSTTVDTGSLTINGVTERRAAATARTAAPSSETPARDAPPTLLARTDVGDVTVLTTGDAGLLSPRPKLDVPDETKENEGGAGSQGKAVD